MQHTIGYVHVYVDLCQIFTNDKLQHNVNIVTASQNGYAWNMLIIDTPLYLFFVIL